MPTPRLSAYFSASDMEEIASTLSAAELQAAEWRVQRPSRTDEAHDAWIDWAEAQGIDPESVDLALGWA